MEMGELDRLCTFVDGCRVWYWIGIVIDMYFRTHAVDMTNDFRLLGRTLRTQLLCQKPPEYYTGAILADMRIR